MEQHTHTILLAGSITVTDRLKAQVSETQVIAADGGIAHAQPLGLSPLLWVGDFDSASNQHVADYPSIPRQTFPAAKAVTDGALAIEQALAGGATSLVLVGAFGGRTDHSFALMAHAAALAHKGIDVLLTSGTEEAVTLRPDPQSFDYAPDTQFSVLGFSALKGLTLTGAQWPLDKVSVPFGDSLTISNAVETRLTASLSHGTALLMVQLGQAGGS